jgi:NAD(P)-dependent dehydrogenase (short-subunit alcohol dehydrogenase family)
MARKLDGQVAVVTGGGDDTGRAIALALGAHGVHVVVAGPDERALGETVGELAHAGAKARHVVGDVPRAADRAQEVFGGLDIVVVDTVASLHAAVQRLQRGGRLLAVGSELVPNVRAIAAELEARGVGCNTLVADGGAPPERIAALAAALCAINAAVVAGATITIS